MLHIQELEAKASRSQGTTSLTARKMEEPHFYTARNILLKGTVLSPELVVLRVLHLEPY